MQKLNNSLCFINNDKNFTKGMNKYYFIHMDLDIIITATSSVQATHFYFKLFIPKFK